jgi:hypothetical protein
MENGGVGRAWVVGLATMAVGEKDGGTGEGEHGRRCGRKIDTEEMKFGFLGSSLSLVTPVGLVQRPTGIINSRRLGQKADGD